MAAPASDWLRHFRLLRWTEFNETWQEARSQRPLPSLCFSGRSEKQDGRPGLWLAETFLTSPLKRLNGIQRNMTGSKISTPSTKFVFFEPIGKTRWPPWPLIGWDIFDFSSETAERNSTKLDRKQDLNALYQVCVFRADRKKQDGRPRFWLAETFSTSPLKVLNRIQQNLIGSKISKPSTKFVFFGPIGKTRWPPRPLIGWDIFDFSVETAEQNSAKLDKKQALNAFYQVCVFQANREKTKWPPWPLIGWDIFDFSSETVKGIRRNLIGSKISEPSTKFVFFGPIGKNKMAAPASDWLRHFRLLCGNRWTEFSETWQEASSQCLLPSLCFSGKSGKNKMAALASDWLRHFRLLIWNCERDSMKLDRKQDLNALYQVCVFQVDRKKQNGRPGLWFAETFSIFPLKPLIRIQQNLIGSKISTSSTRLAFFRADQKNKIAALSSDWLRHFWLLLWNHWMEFNEHLTESKSSTSSTKFVFFGLIQKNEMAALASDWLRHILTFPLKPLNGIQRNLTGSKILTSSTKFVFFWPKSE